MVWSEDHSLIITYNSKFLFMNSLIFLIGNFEERIARYIILAKTKTIQQSLYKSSQATTRMSTGVNSQG